MSKQVLIETERGHKLDGLLDMPEAAGAVPLVLLLHGFTGWKEEKHIETMAEELVKVGIATLRFDAPGSGESEGTFEKDYTMTNYISVVEDVLAWARTSPEIDPERIAVWGHSMGGFVALASAVRYQGFKALCCCQPSSGWKVMEPCAEKEWRETGWATFSNGRLPEIRLPYSFLTDRAHYNALDETPKLQIPSLFIAGARDTDVTPESVKAMANLAISPSQYLEFDTTHGYKRDPEALQAITSATVDFYKKYLLGTGE